MNKASPKSSPNRALPVWFANQLQPLNSDFSERVVALPDDAQWLNTALQGVQMRVLEFVPGAIPRLVAQLRFKHGHQPVILGNHPDLELLVESGHLTSQLGEFEANWYVRLPDLPDENRHELSFRRAASMQASESAQIYLAIGQINQSDTDWRRVDTNDESNWFPGPVDGVDVHPLHGHGTGNVMLVRWNTTAAFRPRIDPIGEELLVVKGAIYDANGFYPAGTWIRNPIVSWQAWGAKAGTIVYYKNGHFAGSDVSLDSDTASESEGASDADTTTEPETTSVSEAALDSDATSNSESASNSDITPNSDTISDSNTSHSNGKITGSDPTSSS